MPTKIEWVLNPDGTQGESWNPVTGCTPVSAGCAHCYARANANRWWGDRPFSDVRCHEDRLEQPLRRKKPTTYFVNSMSDLFHEHVPLWFIYRVFAVMMLTPHHTYLILTKRPGRQAECFSGRPSRPDPCRGGVGTMLDHVYREADYLSSLRRDMTVIGKLTAGKVPHRDWLVPIRLSRKLTVRAWGMTWPLPNVWLGTSVEDQTHMQRIADLFKAPAAKHFVSFEPLLGPVTPSDIVVERGAWRLNALTGDIRPGPTHPCRSVMNPTMLKCALDLVIVGTESGPGARPYDIEHVRSVVRECKAASVPMFVKQITERGRKVPIERWPADLQVREMPS